MSMDRECLTSPSGLNSIEIAGGAVGSPSKVQKRVRYRCRNGPQGVLHNGPQLLFEPWYGHASSQGGKELNTS